LTTIRDMQSTVGAQNECKAAVVGQREKDRAL